MRMRLPKGCAGVTYAGSKLAVVDGTVTVAPEAAVALAAHGLVPVADAPRAAEPRAASPYAERLADRQPDRQPERRPR